jgi:acyl dehydratase
MLPLYFRAAAPLLPGVSRLPGVPGGGRAIPELALRLENIEVDRGELDRYSEVCGFTSTRTLPPTFPHIMAFPLQMALMTDGGFPFGPVGLVHIENSITQHRWLRPSDRLALEVSAGPLAPHPKGRVFTIYSAARVKDELVWEEQSTMLRRGGGDNSSRGASDPAPPEGTVVWSVPGDTGRRYASASGDRNPIHLHALTAKAFGFPRAIAHGMWAKARCLAALEHDLPDSFTAVVRFRKPILLPAKVAFGVMQTAEGTRFSLRDAETAALDLTGLITTTARQGELK